MDHSIIRLGVDVGGTFTDIVIEGDDFQYSTKILTTHDAPENAIMDGMRKVCADHNLTPENIGQVIHGTTLATNALIERKGAKTALITTKGFRDVIEMRTESRFEQYDLNLQLPDPLLSRQHRYTIEERMDATGSVLIPLNLDEVARLGDQLANEGYESIAIGLLHAYANPTHEQKIRDILTKKLPNVEWSLSCEVSPQMREYERFSTTIANAYIKPIMASYLLRLQDRMAQEGVNCPIFMMHSGGGILSLESAAKFPVRLVESGPAGGAIFAAELAKRYGLNKVLSFDMGGTTAKICMIRDQSPKTARVFEVARSYRFKKGSGMPISIPVIDMVEIGAGGGSLAHIDAMKQIRVGPESAGSMPGPACYGRGGTKPAVTDADLVLGKLDPDAFAGGLINLNLDQAKQALDSHIGNTLSMDSTKAAWGVAEVVDETMANAARVHAVENGEDLAGYTMIAFGGAAPLHAARLCQKLGIQRCLIPVGAGVGSAIGFLRAPFSFEASRSVFMRMKDFDIEKVKQLFKEMTEEAEGFVRQCNLPPSFNTKINSDYKLYMRYAGQGWEIPVSLTSKQAQTPNPDDYLSLFEAEYKRLFGRSVDGMAVEIVIWSVNASSKSAPPIPAKPIEATIPAPIENERDLFDPESGEFLTASVIKRETLETGMMAKGPALITEEETTLIVSRGFNAIAQADGTLDLNLN